MTPVKASAIARCNMLRGWDGGKPRGGLIRRLFGKLDAIAETSCNEEPRPRHDPRRRRPRHCPQEPKPISPNRADESCLDRYAGRSERQTCAAEKLAPDAPDPRSGGIGRRSAGALSSDRSLCHRGG